MNAKRRKELKKIVKAIKANENKDSIIIDLEMVLDEEQDSYDNIPESLQYSDRAFTSEEAISDMEDALECLDNDDFESAVSILDKI